MSKRKKGHFKIILAVTIVWFFIMLPAFRIVLKDSLTGGNEFTEFLETEGDIEFLINREKAQYPDQFYLIESQWKTEETIWRAGWHLYKPYIIDSIEEMDNMVITFDMKGSKKGKSQNIAPERYWARIYEEMAAPNFVRVENLALAFQWFREQNELSDYQLLSLIIDYIQQIPYELPENTYGLYTPPEIAYINRGDCDSKSVFASILLGRLGYDTAIFYSSEYRHAMLGINFPSSGYYKEMNGKNYYFTEMTAPGWEIGELPADCPDISFWFISSI